MLFPTKRALLVKQEVFMKNFAREQEITNIFNEAQENLVDGDFKKLDIATILSLVDLSRHAYYGVINSEVLPSKNTLVKVAYAFQLSGEELTRLMNLNGYIYPFTYTDHIVLSFFEKGEADEVLIDEALVSVGEKPIFKKQRSKRTR